MHEKRIESIDILRGYAIILMIMGHLDFGNYFDYYIHAFHMPIWFFITGWFQKKSKLNLGYVKNKMVKLLLPYLFWGLLQYPIWILFNHNSHNKMEPLINLFWINTNLVMPIAGALWFLTCLFFSEILFCFIQTYMVSKIKKFLAVLSCATLGYILPSLLHIRLPWAFDVAMVSVGFISMGHFLRLQYKHPIVYKIFNMSFVKIICLGIINIVGIYNNGYVNLRTGEYSSFIMFWCNSIVAIIVLWNLARVLDTKFSKLFIIKEIKFIGRNSMVYLVLNQLLVLIINKVISWLEMNNMIEIYAIRAVSLVIIVIILHYIARLLSSTKLACVVGK